jgi:hypothetical protein
MFALNLSVWRDDPVVSELVASHSELEGLSRSLTELARSSLRGQIVWGLRQVVLERAG